MKGKEREEMGREGKGKERKGKQRRVGRECEGNKKVEGYGISRMKRGKALKREKKRKTNEKITVVTEG